MVTFRNPLNPSRSPAPYRPANQPRDAARENDGGDLDEIGENKDFIEQEPFELLEMRHYVLPDRDRFDRCLPGLGGSTAAGHPGWRSEDWNSM
jgi:hypothetical protein